MQGINRNQHQGILKALDKFEELLPDHGGIIPTVHEAEIREIAARLKGGYKYYNQLLRELEQCINSYEEEQGLLKKFMYPYLRRMDKKSRRKMRD